MITEWLYALASGFVTWLAELMGPWTPPDIFTDPASVLTSITNGITSMGIWVDWGVLSACVAASVSAWLITLSAKTVRAIAAHIPFVGGSGA